MQAVLTHRRLGWLVAAALLLALTASLIQYHRAMRATVPEVAAQASLSTRIQPRQALRMHVDTLGFPRRIAGFEALGGSTFKVGGRNVAAVVFGHGQQRITYAIVSGTKHVNYYDRAGLYMPAERDVGNRALNWYGDEMVTVKRNEQTIVITGTPASESLRRTISRVALTS